MVVHQNIILEREVSAEKRILNFAKYIDNDTFQSMFQLAKPGETNAVSMAKAIATKKILTATTFAPGLFYLSPYSRLTERERNQAVDELLESELLERDTKFSTQVVAGPKLANFIRQYVPDELLSSLAAALPALKDRDRTPA